MRTKIKFLTLLLAIILSATTTQMQASPQPGSVSFQVFYDQLSPYGQWVDYPDYGYVWIPDAGPDFVPYSTAGRWIYTEYGWTWVSDYDWGWAPFHYGRWDYDDYYGWIWVPDEEWGPSWVTWRRAEGYYGWMPMEPGISISISFGRNYNNQHDHWMFVRDRDIERADIHRYYVKQNVHDRIIKNSTVINTTYIDNSRHTTYVSGPARDDVQKVTGRKVSPVIIKENNQPGQDMRNGQLKIYRPQVQKNNGIQRKSAPTRVTDLKQVKRPSERKATSQPGIVNPPGNSRERQPNMINPVNNNKAKPVQQKNVNPSNNKRMEQLPNTVPPPEQQTSSASPATECYVC